MLSLFALFVAVDIQGIVWFLKWNSSRFSFKLECQGIKLFGTFLFSSCSFPVASTEEIVRGTLTTKTWTVWFNEMNFSPFMLWGLKFVEISEIGWMVFSVFLLEIVYLQLGKHLSLSFWMLPSIWDYRTVETVSFLL